LLINDIVVHRHSHTLDLVIKSANSTLSHTVISSLTISPRDHFPIICLLKITNSSTAHITTHLTRAIRAINITEFCHDILSSCLITHPPSTFSDLVHCCYNSTLSQLLNKHAPLKSKIMRTKPRNPWYTLAQKSLNLLNVILNVSGLILINWMILKTCALLLTIIIVPS